jgi:hypothetical protein
MLVSPTSGVVGWSVWDVGREDGGVAVALGAAVGVVGRLRFLSHRRRGVTMTWRCDATASIMALKRRPHEKNRPDRGPAWNWRLQYSGNE